MSSPKEPIPETRVFVGGISWKADETSLANFFSTFGPVQECKIIMDKVTGKSKGYGFVTFQDVESASRVKQSSNLYFLGKQMNVGDAVRKTEGSTNGTLNQNNGVLHDGSKQNYGTNSQQNFVPGAYPYHPYYNQGVMYQPQQVLYVPSNNLGAVPYGNYTFAYPQYDQATAAAYQQPAWQPMPGTGMVYAPGQNVPSGSPQSAQQPNQSIHTDQFQPVQYQPGQFQSVTPQQQLLLQQLQQQSSLSPNQPPQQQQQLPQQQPSSLSSQQQQQQGNISGQSRQGTQTKGSHNNPYQTQGTLVNSNLPQ